MIMYSTTSQVFLCPRKFIIPCFYQLIIFLANFWHLMEHWSILNVYALGSPCYPFLTDYDLNY